MLRSYKSAFKNPQIRNWISDNFSVKSLTDSGSGIAAGRLVYMTSNTVATATSDASTVLGITRKTVTASDADVQVEFGAVPVVLASPVAQLDNLSARTGGYAAKTLASQVTMVSAETGGGFDNQPAGDAVEILSSSTDDTTQTVTIYGTITGTTDSVTSETMSLNGTTVVKSDITTWVNILGVELSAACAGNVTVQESSGDADIIVITAAATSAGVVDVTATNAYGLIPRHDQSAAGASPVGLIGTGVDGSALSVVDALNGTTEEDHGTTAFGTVTKALIGAVTSDNTVTILTNESTDSNIIGVALEASSAAGVSCDAYIEPYFRK